MKYKLNEPLPEGTILKTVGTKNTHGGEIVIVDKLLDDRGGQSDIYQITWNEKTYALKWYNRSLEDAVGSNQYKAILAYSALNLDTEYYTFPLAIVSENENPESGALFGYIMNLIPDGFYEMHDYLLADGDPRQIKFKSFHAMIYAGMNIVSAVHQIHHIGCCCGNLGPGNVVINPSSVNFRMIDCEIIASTDIRYPLLGTRGYMAPEIVRSNFRQKPTIQTDLFSLAIILFRLFYIDHPMEGRMWDRYPLLTDAVEDELYSIHPVYNMSTKTDINRPNDIWAPNVMSRMTLLPDILREGFENTFVNGIDHVMGRTPDRKWLQILSVARDQLVYLDPKGEQDRIVRFDSPRTIPKGCLRMTIGSRRHELALYPSQKLFKDVLTGNMKDYKECAGRVTVNQGRLCMQNNTDQVWKVHTPGAEITPIPKDSWFFLMPGTQVQFDAERQIVGVVDDPLAQ